jgi:F-type H+-transporting ATPase subunit b
LTADPGAALWNLLIFIAVLFVLMKGVWPKILEGLIAREARIKDDLESADKANRDSQKLLDQYRQQLAAAASETQAILAQARKDAEATGQRLVEQARQEAQQQKERAVAEIVAAKKTALAEMAEQTTTVAVQMARQMIGRELKADDHADVVRQALQRLPSKN